MNEKNENTTASQPPPTTESTVSSLTGEKRPRQEKTAGEMAALVRRERDWLVDTALERGRGLLLGKLEILAQTANDVAETLHSSARKLAEKQDTATAHYFDLAADGFDRASSALESKDLETMVYRTREFARANPVLFLGGMATAGFMISRFIKSSPEEVERKAGGEQVSVEDLSIGQEERRQERPYSGMEAPGYATEKGSS